MKVLLSLCIVAASSLEDLGDRIENLGRDLDSDVSDASGSTLPVSTSYSLDHMFTAAGNTADASNQPMHTSQLTTGVSSILSGSFSSADDLRTLLPLERLLVEKPYLFLRPDGRDPLGELATSLGVTRRQAAKNFIRHNYKQLEPAFDKILASTNDVVIAALAIDPFSVADADLVRPITDVLIDYLRVKADRCMLDLLPHVFQDPAVYDRYFTPLPGYQVFPNMERGYTAVIPGELIPSTAEHPRIVEVTVGDNPIISIKHWSANYAAILVDIRCGCAIEIKRPYLFANFFEVERWLALRDTENAEVHIWRIDSLEPLIVPIPGVTNFLNFNTFVDGSRVLLHHDSGIYTLPNDTEVPFEATIIQNLPTNEVLQPTKSGKSVYNHGGDGTVVSLTQIGLEKAARFIPGLSTSILEALGCSLQELKERIRPIFREIRMVAHMAYLLEVSNYAECWLIVMEISSRYNLRTRSEFTTFIVAVVNGLRPAGIDSLHPLSFFQRAIQ